MRALILHSARIFICYAILAGSAAAAVRYEVTLTVDPAHQVLHGRQETMAAKGQVFRKGPGVTVSRAELGNTAIEFAGDRVTMPGDGRVRFEYEARAGQGFRWLPDGDGFFTAFHCEAWMICDPDPVQRATLRLEIAIPASTGWTVAGAGLPAGRRRVGGNDHFVFEEKAPAQTYLFSFGAGVLRKFEEGNLTVYAGGDPGGVFGKTRDAWAFLRSKAGVEARGGVYAQAFLPGVSFGQEASGLALMGEEYRKRLAGEEDDVGLMAHEAAHQWWGVLVGIRSWSDFWLNEGMAEFFTAAYLEHRKGRGAYDLHLSRLREAMAKLQREGLDRPLHWTQWTTAREALGRLPYVKGALFLDALREALGEGAFWRGVAGYTKRHAGGLVDSRDFQKSMEEAAGRRLAPLFDAWVYR